MTRWQQRRNDMYWGFVIGLAWFTIFYVADLIA